MRVRFVLHLGISYFANLIGCTHIFKEIKKDGLLSLKIFLVLLLFSIGVSSNAQLVLTEDSQVTLSEDALLVIQSDEETITYNYVNSSLLTSTSESEICADVEKEINADIEPKKPKIKSKQTARLNSKKREKGTENQYTQINTVEKREQTLIVFRSYPGNKSISLGNVKELISTSVPNLFIFPLSIIPEEKLDDEFIKNPILNGKFNLFNNYHLESLWARPPPKRVNSLI